MFRNYWCDFNPYAGIVDSSGMRMYYTDQPPKIETEMLILGHVTIGHMIIPPGVERYTVTAFCSQKCTETVSFKLYIHIQYCSHTSLHTWTSANNFTWEKSLHYTLWVFIIIFTREQLSSYSLLTTCECKHSRMLCSKGRVVSLKIIVHESLKSCHEPVTFFLLVVVYYYLHHWTVIATICLLSVKL